MEYVKLGNSDLNVSRICLGCMGFGEAAAGQHRWTLDEESSNEIIKAALENGINFFDTAMSYQGGTSEMFVGRVLRDFARREDVVLATKFEPRTDEEIANGVTGLVNAVELRLTADEIAYLEEPYVPHALVGVMAQNHG